MKRTTTRKRRRRNPSPAQLQKQTKQLLMMSGATVGGNILASIIAGVTTQFTARIKNPTLQKLADGAIPIVGGLLLTTQAKSPVAKAVGIGMGATGLTTAAKGLGLNVPGLGDGETETPVIDIVPQALPPAPEPTCAQRARHRRRLAMANAGLADPDPQAQMRRRLRKSLSDFDDLDDFDDLADPDPQAQMRRRLRKSLSDFDDLDDEFVELEDDDIEDLGDFADIGSEEFVELE